MSAKKILPRRFHLQKNILPEDAVKTKILLPSFLASRVAKIADLGCSALQTTEPT